MGVGSYFASEGFLPGYNFPRLPLSAWIPARRGSATDEYLSRPRFVAISEFGPQALVYHEGSVYRVNRVMIPVSSASAAVSDDPVVTTSAIQCGVCGYLHPAPGGVGPDRCERCGAELADSKWRYRSLFRMTSVSTRRQDRINSNAEERQRRGYEIRSAYRWAEIDGRPSVKTATVTSADAEPLANLAYGHIATLTLINVGWARRKDRNEQGFLLDLERGRWAPRPDDKDLADDDPLTGRLKPVVPFVEDRRNILVFDPAGTEFTPAFMASLQAALKIAIQAEYDLEDTELAGVSLPDRDDRGTRPDFVYDGPPHLYPERSTTHSRSRAGPRCSWKMPLRFDLGPDGEKVDETIEHLRHLAGLGVQVAHGTLIGAGFLHPLEMMAERVIPFVSEF